jgi:hypothetical protein
MAVQRLLLTLLAVALASGATAGVARASVSLAAAGDIACDPASTGFAGGLGTDLACRQRQTAGLLSQRSYDAVLALGDNQYEAGALSDYLAAYDLSWGSAKAITRPVPGNHEYGTPGAAGYFDYFNGPGVARGPAGPRRRGFYSYDLGRWHLVALNSYCPAVPCGKGSEQLRWLRADLARSASSCVLAYWHRPRFSSGAHGGDPAIGPIWRVLTRARVELALSGHDHDYERFAPLLADGSPSARRGVRQFVVGTGGRELRPFSTPWSGSRRRLAGSFGVLDLRLRRDSYRWAFRSEPLGRTLDRGRSSCR